MVEIIDLKKGRAAELHLFCLINLFACDLSDLPRDSVRGVISFLSRLDLNE